MKINYLATLLASAKSKSASKRLASDPCVQFVNVRMPLHFFCSRKVFGQMIAIQIFIPLTLLFVEVNVMIYFLTIFA
jgi:hypothetical protein